MFDMNWCLDRVLLESLNWTGFSSFYEFGGYSHQLNMRISFQYGLTTAYQFYMLFVYEVNVPRTILHFNCTFRLILHIETCTTDSQ